MPNSMNEDLYAKCIAGTATTLERQELIAWLALPQNEELAKQWLLAVINSNDQSIAPNEKRSEMLLQAIFTTVQQPAAASPVVRMQPPGTARRRWLPYVAAAFVLLSSATWWWLNNQSAQQPTIPAMAEQKEIQPAKQGAVLTLADGRQLVLDSMNNGVIAIQNGANVLLQNGRLSYGATPDTLTALNTIATPRGRKYDLLLADGTHIWLNAASSVTYPTAFNQKERRIKVTGEAYLEVAKDKQRPFIIDVDGRSSAQVLGTSFNIKAYTEEAGIETTLIEGALKVHDQILKPGQQAQQDRQGGFTIVDNADTDLVLAWKNGIFNFNNAELQTVMRELARWYDIEVVYKGAIPKRNFKGEIGRDLTLSQVLKGLQRMDLNFEIDGNKIVVKQ